jgi:hypothetical protein
MSKDGIQVSYHSTTSHVSEYHTIWSRSFLAISLQRMRVQKLCLVYYLAVFIQHDCPIWISHCGLCSRVTWMFWFIRICHCNIRFVVYIYETEVSWTILLLVSLHQRNTTEKTRRSVTLKVFQGTIFIKQL